MNSHLLGHLQQLKVSIVNHLLTDTSIVNSTFTKHLSLTLCKELDILNTHAYG